MSKRICLEWVRPGDWTEADFAWLELADVAGPAFHSIDRASIEGWLLASQMHLFRIKVGHGVLLVEVIASASGARRLRLVRFAGQNLGWLFPQLAELLQHTAKEWGCQAIESMVYSPRLAQAMLKVGAKAEAVNVVLEV